MYKASGEENASPSTREGRDEGGAANEESRYRLDGI
jgi:hypothetical protein